MRAISDLGLGDTDATVVALGAHPDDVEIGAGGTLLQLTRRHPGLRVVWFIGSATPARSEEARAAAQSFVSPERLELVIADHPDGWFPGHWAQVKASLVALRERVVDPRLVFAPRLEDRHQDHAVVAALVRQVWRDHLIARYEVPKFETERDTTNVLVALEESAARDKVELLLAHHRSQHDKPWFDRETFTAQLRRRGVQARTTWAEAYTVEKMVWG